MQLRIQDEITHIYMVVGGWAACGVNANVILYPWSLEIPCAAADQITRNYAYENFAAPF